MVKEKKSSDASLGHIDRAKRCSRTVNHMVEEDGSNDEEVERPLVENKEINHIGTREGRTLSSKLSAADSSYSNPSDASTGSFTLPVQVK
ncbi:hypothetical protein ACH5RR_008713 [Cinchona calisaya]|uniref:Uncharacterized protein n=1 Tax=Cinchona calisaya TaxID=153742 RepID=A0ABD3AEM1_9GENT